MTDLSRVYDVLVVGGGTAALCAAVAARRAGASVLLAEWAPRDLRGGNTRHSRNFRVAHAAPTALSPGVYTAEEYGSDVLRATEGASDGALTRVLARESADIAAWLAEHGVRFEEPAGGRLPLSRKTAFFLGGGKAMVNALYAAAGRLGVDLLYDCEVRALRLDGVRAGAATVVRDGAAAPVRARSVVVCSGGFQADRARLRAQCGAAAEGFLVRGTPYATGTLLWSLLEQGAAAAGDPARCHLVAVDGRSPPCDGGIVTRLDCVPHGIVVDRDGRRFHDEGADRGPTRYSVWGGLVAQRPGQVAYAIFDADAEGRFMPSVFPAIRAGTIPDLAATLGIDPAALEDTVRTFNAAVRPAAGGEGHTEGLSPPKTRGAQPVAVPPFGCYPLRPGVTFTYLGVQVDEAARVLLADGRPVRNLFAAGMIMAPNILGRGYLSGVAVTIGAVFGRIAGREAAAHARR